MLLACLTLIGAPYEWLVHIETVLGEGFFSLSFEAKKGKVANINFDLADLASNFYWFTRAGPTIFTAIAHPQLRLLKYCTERDGERLALPFLFLSELTRQLPLDFFSIKDKAIKASMIATMEFSLDFLIQYGRHLSAFLFSLMERNIKLPENKMYIYVLRLMFPIRFSEHPEQVMLNEFSNEFISLLWNGLGEDFFSLPEEMRVIRFVDYFSNIVLMKRHAKEIHGAMLEFKIKRPMFHFFLKIAQRIPAEELTNHLLDFMISKLRFDFFACDIEEQRGRFATIDWFDGSIQVSLLFLNALLNTLEDHVAVSNTALGLLKWIDSSCVDINVLRVVAKQLGEDFFFLEQAEQDNRFQACMIDPRFIQAHRVSFSYLTQTLIRSGFRIPNSFLFTPPEPVHCLMRNVYSEEMVDLRRNSIEVVKKKREYLQANFFLHQLEYVGHDMQNKYILPELGVIIYPVGEHHLEVCHELSELEIIEEQAPYILARKPGEKPFLIQKKPCVIISIQHAARYEGEKQLYEKTGIQQNNNIDLHLQQRFFLTRVAEFFNRSPDELNTELKVIKLAELIGVDFFYLKESERFERFKDICQRRAQGLYELIDEIDRMVGQSFLLWVLTQKEVDLLMQMSSIFFTSLDRSPIFIRDTPIEHGSINTPASLFELSDASPFPFFGSSHIDSPQLSSSVLFADTDTETELPLLDDSRLTPLLDDSRLTPLLDDSGPGKMRFLFFPSSSNHDPAKCNLEELNAR